MDVTIESLTAEAARAERPRLSALLADCVDSGASVGFLPPLSPGEADEYWTTVAAAVAGGACVLLVARRGDGCPVGTVQLDLVTRPNARHRAEVMRLMVHTGARRRGIGRALMLAIETEARQRGRTTLVLDTRQGDPSERLYASLGYRRAGTIPEYARSANGALDPSASYYRILAPADANAPGRTP
jgi:ribosomal protein S18 acetylase RimI-like enzyme